MISYIKHYEGKLSGIDVKCEIFAMQTLPMMNAQTIPGDCGGAVVMLHPSATRKLIGMHIGSATNVVTMRDGCLDSRSTGLIAILSLERLHVLTGKAYMSSGEYKSGTGFPKITWAKPNKYDNFHELITDADIGLHLPVDEDDSITYYGDLARIQPPCDVKGKTDHYKTPFYGCFEETKKPSALIEAHVPDTSKLLKDANGNPSILVTQLSGYAGKTYEIPADIMSTMIEQLKAYMIEVMRGHAIGTSANSKTAMWEALNGQYFNDDFDKINEKSSAGIPWSNLGASNKNDFLERKRILNMYRTSTEDKFVEGFYLKDDKVTKYFKRVFNNKLEQAKQLKRTFSIWKACLKDELRKLEKIQYGTTRAFIAPPMESFLMGRYLFGRWKAAFKSNPDKLFHGLGIDMKSLDVTDFVTKFKRYKYFMDVDYKNFDQKLLAQFIRAVGVIIIETIRHYEHNDEYANARYVYFEELICTIICASKTLFMTNRGNKSGNVLTTELNCLVNFMYGWYVFIKTRNDTSLQTYLQYVYDKNFGDDKAIGITQEAADWGFNFFAYKKVMAEIGQTVTPGNKSDVELPYFDNICDLQFLKRGFHQLLPSVWIAPLDKTSIESVFNYSCLTEEEIEEWQATIREQLIEAMLHGKKYYSTFAKKLLEFISTCHFKSCYPELREAIIPILLNRYIDVLRAYMLRIGVLAPSDVQNKIYCESIFENGRNRLRYYTKENKFESEIITESCDKSLMSVMDNVKKFIQQKGQSLYNLGLNYGNHSPQEVNPETDIQFEGVQSDIGPPVKVMSADGLVYAYDLGQSHGLLPKEIPPIMDVAMSLPDNIKHFQLLDSIYLNGIQPRVVLSPTLKDIAPKAEVLMDIFKYHRAKMCLLRIDSRPPLGFSQLIKVAITSTSATDDSTFNRQGVTYNLAKCPVMYFLIPFCDRDFVKSRDEKWFKVLIEQVTPPILRTDIPEPFRFRPSFEVLELDYFVHKNRQETTPAVEGIPLSIIPTTALSVAVVNNPLLGTGLVNNGSTITLRGDVLAIDGDVGGTNQANTSLYVLREGTTGVLNIVNYGTGIQLQFVSAGLIYTLLRDSDYVASSTGSFTGRVNGLQVGAAGSPQLGIIGHLPTSVRKRIVAPVIAKTEDRTHVYAADILDHQVDRKFEELYWQNKGKRGFVLPGHKYEGPGNSLNNGVPTNEMDALARKHDLQYAWASYLYANKRIDKQTFEAKIHAADEELATNSNLTSLDGIIANLGMRAKKFVEHFTGLLYPSTGRYEDEEATDSELIKQFSCVKPIDYISILKERCDESGDDLKYSFKRLKSPDNAPLYECVCMVGERRFSAVEIGKKKSKRIASYIMLLAFADGSYQSDIDPAASEPSAPKNPMPPVAVASPGSLAAGQTVGTIGARVEVTEQDFIPINTVTVQANAATNDMIFKMRIHPGNFTSGGLESQAQIAYRNHVFSGPAVVNGKISYNTFKITSAANAFQNARIIIAQIPLDYTSAQVDALKATDLKQFPNREHFLHGTETIFNPQWVNRLPVISNHATDPSNTNGWLVAKILENSLADDSTAPRLTYWVCANAVVYSMPRSPAALPAVTS
ncbi:MAG: RNA-dependent RNA polymerase [Guiyang argiope bruennichi nora-like virus 2]|nr:MAG: RNA-dependent RNA polymerase [Guiyang argiope bruennichi nora-like virus 2]